MRCRRLPCSLALAALLLLAALVPAPAVAASLPAGTTAVISGTPDLLSLLAVPADFAESGSQAISADGRLVVFSSGSDGLVADDDDDATGIYVKDLATGAVQLVSRASDRNGVPGEPSHGSCGDAAISDDGNAVAFDCSSPLDPANDTNDVNDVYVRNLATRTTKLVSRAMDGSAVGDARGPAIDGTGRFVAFTSDATTLVAGLPAGHVDRVYRRDTSSDAVTLISTRASDGAPNDLPAGSPSIDDAGDAVAFSTLAKLDTVADTNNFFDVYVHADGVATQLVSRADGTGPVGADNSSEPAISGDGRAVAFGSAASFDVRDADGGGSDAYVRLLGASPVTRLLSVNGTSGAKADDESSVTGIGTNGGSLAQLAVGFESRATNLDPADTSSALDDYLFHGGAVELVSRGDGAGPAANGAGPMAVSGDGSKVAMSIDAGHALTPDVDQRKASVAVRDLAANPPRTLTASRPAGTDPFVNAGGGASAGSVSADGRYVAFVSSARGLGVPDGIAQAVFVRDVATGAVVLASPAVGVDGAITGSFGTEPHISADGRRVAFVLAVPGGPNHVLVRDLPTGRTFVADRPDGPDTATLGNGSADQPTIGDDGNRVAFVSTATNLVGDSGALKHAYVRDLSAARTHLVDRSTGAAGTPGAGTPQDLAIAGDGRSVAFATTSALDPDDSDTLQDIYVRAIDAGTTQLVSTTGQTKGNGTSRLPSLNRDGSLVAFISAATNLVTDPPGTKLYLRNLATGALTVIGRADGADGAIVSDPVRGLLSADGARFAFEARPITSIAPGAPADGVARVYERDLGSGATRLISRRTGADGVPSSEQADLTSLTADGGCVVFTGSRHFLAPPANADSVQVYLRAVTPDCGRPAGGGGNGGGGGPGSGAALLSRLALKPARFHVGGRKGGTKILFRLSRASSVTLAFDRLAPGHKKGKRCSTKIRKGRRCTVVRRAGRLVVQRGRAGANTVKFSGKVGRRALPVGRYRLTATPLHGKARTLRFVVVKAPKPRPRRARH